MAEVVGMLGLIASILGVLEGIDKSKSIIKKYVHSSASLRAELVPLLGKLTAFAGILRGLQLECELDESDNGRLQIFAHIRDPLEASKKAAQTIMTRLDQVVSVGGISLSFGKVLNKETSAALHILDQTKAVLDLALTADQRTLLKSIETYVRNVAEDLRDIREESKIHYQDLKDDLYSIRANEAETEKAKAKADVLTWVSQVNYSSNFYAALLPTREDDESGDWFIDSQQFQEWCERSGPRGLVLTGISGAGKTVICSKAINHLTRNRTITDLNPSIIYFFFDFNDVAKQNVEGMIRSLIFQLIAKLEEIPQVVRKLYSSRQSATSLSALPAFKDWQDILIFLLRSTKASFVFIDALDECTEAESNLLQETLQKLFKETGPRVKWLLTCRPSQRSISILQDLGFVHRSMDAGVIDNDIERYLSTRLKKDPSLASFGPLARDLIVSQIKSKSSGMFRFAQCQLTTLVKLKDRRVKKVQEVLDAMPEDLYSTYSRILDDLQSSDDWPVVDRILAFVSYSARPVTVAEVAEFAILEDEMTNVQPEERFEDFTEILSLISSLINVQDGNLTLAHKSVQDFLVTRQERGDFVTPYTSDLLYRGADIYIAKRCLQYLAFPQQPVCDIAEARNVKDPNTRHLAKLLTEYPFLDYAASRWPHHVRTKELQEEAAEQMQNTLPFTANHNLWKAWLMLQRADIWETQLQLARLLCEASIRSALVPDWAHDFWQARQDYRVRSDAKKPSLTKPDQQSKPNHAAVPTSLHSFMATFKAAAKHMETSSKTHTAGAKAQDGNSSNNALKSEKESGFYVKALWDLNAPEEADLSFRKGDLILILGTEYKDWWKGSLEGRTGLVPANYVERCDDGQSEEVTGSPFYDLGVLLLEVALQTTLFATTKPVLANISSQKDLKVHLTQLSAMSNRAAKTMGQKYGAVVRECLSNVKYAKQFEAKNLFELQDYAMEKLHSPLQSMLKSGFRASRSPVGGLRGQITRTGITASAGTLQDSKSMPLGGTYGTAYAVTVSSTPAPYPGSATPDYIYGAGRYTSAPFSEHERPTSYEYVSTHYTSSTPNSEIERPTTYAYEYTSTRYGSSSVPPMPIRSATLNMATPSLNTVVEKKEEDERTEEEKLIDWIRQIQKKEVEAMAMSERTNIQERIWRMNEEGPFELPGVIEAKPEKSEGEMAVSALSSTVAEKKEEDERTEEEKTMAWIRQIREKEAEATAHEEYVKFLERAKRMEEGPFELPRPVEAELKKLEQERTEWLESDSAVSATKNDEVPARAEAEPRAINPILSKDEVNEFKDDETAKEPEKQAAEAVAPEVQGHGVDRSEIASIHPATQVEYPFLSFLELRDGWTLMEVGCDTKGHVLFSRKEEKGKEGLYRWQDKGKGVTQYVQYFYPKSQG